MSTHVKTTLLATAAFLTLSAGGAMAENNYKPTAPQVDGDAQAQMDSSTTLSAGDAATISPEAGASMEISTSDIKKAQEALNNNGYEVAADGVMGKKTQNALKSFQSANDLPATGELDSQTLAALDIEATTNNSSM